MVRLEVGKGEKEGRFSPALFCNIRDAPFMSGPTASCLLSRGLCTAGQNTTFLLLLDSGCPILRV